MTKTDWTAEEVRAVASKLHVPNEWVDINTLAAMLTAFAERIAADESAVPVAEVGRDWTLHWVGQQETPCSLNEALNVIENWGRRGNTLNGDDVSRFRALADKIAPAQEQPGWKDRALQAEELCRAYRALIGMLAASPTPPKEK